MPDAAVPNITLKELEEMVDSSCRNADKVQEDDQSVYGELWLMRSALWHYWPFDFHIVYHVFHGSAFVMLFRYRRSDAVFWEPVSDTDTYQRMLVFADQQRQQINPKTTV